MDNLRCVRNLKDLIKGVLTPNEKILDSELSRLTAPGENYGSIMLRIRIRIKDTTTGYERCLDTVGKVIPNSERILQVFNTQITFRNEWKYYALIVPILDRFLKSKGFEEGADFSAPFYGGRLNLDSSERVDEDAIILMKNLKSAGYTIGKKNLGLDIESVKVVLDGLAKFHSAGLALKLQHPESFEQNLRPYFYRFVPDAYLFQVILKNLIPTLDKNGFGKEELDVVKTVYLSDPYKKNISDQWGTMIHYDTWTNNVLLKYDGSTPVHCVLVDFQFFEYGTPLDDVMLFLFTSLQQQSLEQDLDNLLHYYYEKFTSILAKLGVDTTPFTKPSFDAEVASAVKNYEYAHTMWMLEPIMHEEFKSLEDLSSDDVKLTWTDEHIRKITFITRQCFERGWL